MLDNQNQNLRSLFSDRRVWGWAVRMIIVALLGSLIVTGLVFLTTELLVAKTGNFLDGWDCRTQPTFFSSPTGEIMITYRKESGEFVTIKFWPIRYEYGEGYTSQICTERLER